jgi:Flp pilus assembly protein TadD
MSDPSRRWLTMMATIVAVAGLTFEVFAASSDSDDAPAIKEYRQAVKSVKGGRYQEAVDLLVVVVRDDPKSADAHNYLGYSYRKLGRYDEALTHYTQALEIAPEHRGANEYLGELYLETGNLEAAEERLQVLDKACFLPCGEYRDLKQMIEEYKKNSQG